MLTLLLSSLIVYGITNILVYGSIFERIKTKFRLYIHQLKNFNVTLDKLITYTDSSLKFKKLKEKFNYIQDCLQNDQSEEIINSLEDSKQELLSYIKEKTFPKFRIWLFSKIDQLFQCMMCTGFWIGLFFTILTTIFNISIFNISLCVITTTGISYLISLFFMTCMFSGICWIVSSFVQLFVELTDKYTTTKETIIEDK